MDAPTEDHRGLGQLVAYIDERRDRGPILAASGAFSEEATQGGHDIADHNIPTPEFAGLAVFEGWLWVQGDPGEVDVRFDGSWRPLTHWELCRFAKGISPWD